MDQTREQGTRKEKKIRSRTRKRCVLNGTGKGARNGGHAYPGSWLSISQISMFMAQSGPMSMSLVARSTMEFTISGHRRFETGWDRLFSDDHKPNYRRDRRTIPAIFFFRSFSVPPCVYSASEDSYSLVLPLRKGLGVRIVTLKRAKQSSRCENLTRVGWGVIITWCRCFCRPLFDQRSATVCRVGQPSKPTWYILH